MDYQKFVEEVKKSLEEKLGGTVSISIANTVKNNDTQRTGLTIISDGVRTSPTIYMEKFYSMYENEYYDMDEIIESVLRTHEQVKLDEDKWDINSIKKFNEMRSKIVYKLINKKQNEVLLEKMPYVGYMDLAITFYVLFDIDDDGVATIPITNELMDIWGVTVEDIYTEATENSPRIIPSVLRSMREVLEELQCEEQEDSCLLVLTNSIKSFGASCVLYKGELEKIREELGENYYLLPSSVHEMIVLPESLSSPIGLNGIVKEVNDSLVDQEEILSNNIYYYNTEIKELTIVGSNKNR